MTKPGMTQQVDRMEKNVERRKIWLQNQKEKKASAEKLSQTGFLSTMG